MSFENYVVIKPEDLNHYGFLFGGKLLLWVDEYSWIAASLDFPDCKFVTKCMDKVEFNKSVTKGSILKFSIIKTEQKRAHVNYAVKVFSKLADEEFDSKPIFQTTVKFVNIGNNGKVQAIK